MPEQPFNVRVYGLLINDKDEVLISYESVKGKKVTKFPGGGMEFGEGTQECLIREYLEEAKLKINIIEHFYTTDFFQQSAFNSEEQIISIYYLVASSELGLLDLQSKEYSDQTFKWLSMDDLNAELFALPIDKKVVKMLIERFVN